MSKVTPNRKGEVNYNTRGCKMEILNYRSVSDIDVYFEEYNWIKYHCQYSTFKRGRIKCPYERTMFGVGYFGEGKYLSRVIGGDHTKCYLTWKGMFERCYDEKYLKNKPSYEGCTVCKEWHNFQNFAEWYENNYYEVEDERMCLDKDILVKGNKIYSPETCLIVNERINTLFTKSNKVRGKYPIGVLFNKECKKFLAKCSIRKQGGDCHQVQIGAFDNPEDAFYAYKKYKENYIKSVADKYSQLIPQKIYNAMYNYEVEITD